MDNNQHKLNNNIRKISPLKTEKTRKNIFLLLVAITCTVFFSWKMVTKTTDIPLSTHYKNTLFVTLPDIIVNLRSEKDRTSLLKAVFTVEVESDETKKVVEHQQSILIDQCHSYLRSCTEEDLQDISGVERVRGDLLTRINNAINPFKIKQLLIHDFVIQ
ncbi:MAG: flagellar basal body-associated FliL family protein [Alphaproteobacteria bacterium]